MPITMLAQLSLSFTINKYCDIDTITGCFFFIENKKKVVILLYNSIMLYIHIILSIRTYLQIYDT